MSFRPFRLSLKTGSGRNILPNFQYIISYRNVISESPCSLEMTILQPLFLFDS